MTSSGHPPLLPTTLNRARGAAAHLLPAKSVHQDCAQVVAVFGGQAAGGAAAARAAVNLRMMLRRL